MVLGGVAMKRVLGLLVGGALILGSALPLLAQQAQQQKKPLEVPGLTPDQNMQLDKVLTPAPFTVTFSGQMRTIGITSDNLRDYANSDTNPPAARDSEARLLQRFRLGTTVQSADQKVRAQWILEIGDVTFGAGGGSNGGEYNCPGAAPIVNPTVTVPPPAGSPPGTPPTPATVTSGTPSGSTRVGNSSGGCLGADGVNVETKRLLLRFEVPGVPNLAVTTGIQGFSFLNNAPGPVWGDDGSGIKLNWKADPVDVEAFWAKVSEGNNFNADDVDMWVIKVGANVTKDVRLTLEGMVIDERNLAGQSFGDTFWIGATANANIGTINLDGGLVYGQRAHAAVGSPGNTFDESGYGVNVTARIPIGPVNVALHGFYTSGDDTRPAGGPSGGALTKDSDRLPVPVAGASWGNVPYIAEFIMGGVTLEQFGVGTATDENPAGLYAIGAAVTYGLTPDLVLGGGVAYVGATDAPGPFGDSALEIDGGLRYQLYQNLRLQFTAGYIFPDKGDDAWSVGFLTSMDF
jgi:hypothetical protein